MRVLLYTCEPGVQQSSLGLSSAHTCMCRILGNAPAHHPDSMKQKAGADPVNLAVGQSVGGLGLMMQNRRRNRVNSTLTSRAGSRLSLRVEQAFGNCPKYIQVCAPPNSVGNRPLVRREAAMLACPKI